MTDQVNVFEDGKTATTEKPVESSNPIQDELLSEFVGEGKKYATVEEAIKSVPHAQSHISKLEEELRTLREELGKSRSAAEILAELKEAMTQNTNNDEPTSPNVVSPEVINELVDKALKQKTAEQQAADNIRTANRVMVEKFGEKAQKVLVDKATELGMDVSYLKATAARSPKAFLALMGVQDSAPAATGSMRTTSSSVNTEVLDATRSGDKPSAKVATGATTKDMINAWRAAKPE